MKKYLSLGLYLMVLASCQNNKKAENTASSDSTFVNQAVLNKDKCESGIMVTHAHAYNNFIVDNQGKIVEKSMEFSLALHHKEYAKVSEIYKQLTSQTQNSIDSVSKLCSFNGNESYKNSAVELFKFYQKAWETYKPLVDLKTEKEFLVAYEKVNTTFDELHSKTEKELEDKFKKEHTDFSYTYELHVRNTKLHETLDTLLFIK